MTPFQVLPLTFAISMLGALGVWVLSLRLRDAGIVDILWGYGFGVLALTSYVLGQGEGARAGWLLALTLLWSLRLGTHLLLRTFGRAEDFRYAAMRAAQGADFERRSLVSIFVFQAAIQWLLSLPLQVGLLWPGSAGFSWLDGVSAAVFAVGFATESLADFQLERFRRDPQQHGRVLDRGLWRYSRHPNYFGECLIAWGLFGVAAGTEHGIWFVWSPMLLTYLLTRVSGVPYLEAGLRRRIPGYRDYVQRTPRFVPGRPRPSALG